MKSSHSSEVKVRALKACVGAAGKQHERGEEFKLHPSSAAAYVRAGKAEYVPEPVPEDPPVPKKSKK